MADVMFEEAFSSVVSLFKMLSVKMRLSGSLLSHGSLLITLLFIDRQNATKEKKLNNQNQRNGQCNELRKL